MKIGVFGDSYADKCAQGYADPIIWYNFLEHNHGHDIDSFGEWGSSILFSARLIEEKAQDYDLVIWCLTTPGRITLPHEHQGRHIHVTNTWDKCMSKDPEIVTKHRVCIDYLKYIYDNNNENFIGRAIVNYLQHLHKNIMIVPCFPPPLGCDFNLFTLCEIEAGHYFPGKSLSEIYKTHQDLRPGHITIENQKILGALINQQLGPGIFQTSYDNFVKPTQPIQELFIPL